MTLTESWSPSNGPMLNETDQGDWKLGTDADQEFRLHQRQEPPKARRRFRIKRTQAVGLASIFAASGAIILYLALPADYSVQKRANGANPMSRETTSLAPENRSSVRNGPSTKTAETPADERVEERSPKLNRDGSPSAKTADTIQANLASFKTTDKTTETADSAGKTGLGKTWSVQISAAP